MRRTPIIGWRWSVLAATIAVGIVAVFSSANAQAQDAKGLIALVEKVSIAPFSYSVTVSSADYVGRSASARTRAAATGPATMVKKPGGRLRNLPASGQRGTAREGTRSSVPFVLDLSSMLSELSGVVTWELGGLWTEGDEPCKVLTTREEGWRIDLCVRTADGAILRYVQYLKGKQVGISHITYGAPINGVYLPASSRTYFPLTDQTVELSYRDYVVEAR